MILRIPARQKIKVVDIPLSRSLKRKIRISASQRIKTAVFPLSRNLKRNFKVRLFISDLEDEAAERSTRNAKIYRKAMENYLKRNK